MVWALFPVDPLPGEDKYYFFSKGTYKVGRKGCDVIISNDKGVSRVHAEIYIDEMTSLDSKSQSSNMSSKVRIRDCSKYGTFIKNDTGSKEKVHEFPNKEAFLKDGDSVSFGTGSATYRYSFVPIVLLNRTSDTPKQQKHLQEKILSIGAEVIRNWSPKCTHVLVDDVFHLKEEFVDVIVAKKPFASHKWFELIAGNKICTEIPNCSSYAPSFLHEGRSITVSDPKSRENCLKGYTFVLESKNQYKLKDRLLSLLEVGGGTIVSLDEYCADSQGLEEGARRVARVIPEGTSDTARNIGLLSSVKELDIVSAVFSGNLDPTIIVSPPVLVTSSCSTDETVVADSEPETETETATSVQKSFAVESSDNDMDEMKKIFLTSLNNHGKCEEIVTRVTENVEIKDDDNDDVVTLNTIDHETKYEVPCIKTSVKSSDSGSFTRLKDGGGNELTKPEKQEGPESGHTDVLYSQNLIVRDSNLESLTSLSRHDTTLNFKRFRKMNTTSGNSFTSLIPFAKYPYRESEYGNEEVKESVKEEKERKKMEAIAEDLFNHEKGRKRGGSGSILGILSRK